MTKQEWYTISVYVDTDTGEILTRTQALNEYNILSKQKKIKINETNEKAIGEITYIYQCKKSQQLKLFE